MPQSVDFSREHCSTTVPCNSSRHVERGGRVEGSEGCTRTATTLISDREKCSRLRRSSKARKLDAECGGRGGFVSSVTISRKSICGAKLGGFVIALVRLTREISNKSNRRRDKMEAVLSILSIVHEAGHEAGHICRRPWPRPLPQWCQPD